MEKSESKKSSLIGALIGDELGQIKRIDITSKSCKLISVNSESIDSIHPSKSVTSISCLESNFNNNVQYLITKKCNTLSLYNCLTNELTGIRIALNNEWPIIGAQAINSNNIVLCYENGSIHVQNIEKELLLSNETKKKAIKLLGLDLYGNTSSEGSSNIKSAFNSMIDSKTSNKDIKPRPKTSQFANSVSHSSFASSSTSIYSPNWNPTNTSFTCFKVCNNNLAIAGRNVDLKVFDLTTNQNTFTAKSSSRDWLGLKPEIWVSGVDWVGGNSRNNSSPSMVATCSRSDSTVRIYDMKSRNKKPIININLKDQTFNNDSNPPSFTSICSTSAPHSIAIPTQNVILGTTIGRMLAVDLRFNSRSYRHLGVFKGFGGGAIRDIKYVSQTSNAYKILSCSLDRFVRVHNFSTSASSKRSLDTKIYVKTRPTCLQPICSTFMLDSNVPNIDDSDSDSE